MTLSNGIRPASFEQLRQHKVDWSAIDWSGGDPANDPALARLERINRIVMYFLMGLAVGAAIAIGSSITWYLHHDWWRFFVRELTRP